MPNRSEFDERNNALVVAGAVMLVLHESEVVGKVDVVDDDDNVTLVIHPPFMQSPYHVMIVRDSSGDTS